MTYTTLKMATGTVAAYIDAQIALGNALIFVFVNPWGTGEAWVTIGEP